MTFKDPNHQIDVPLLSSEKKSSSLKENLVSEFCHPVVVVTLVMVFMALAPTPIRIPDSIQIDAATISSFEISSSSSRLTANWSIDFSYGSKYGELIYNNSTVKACVSLNHNGITICSDDLGSPYSLYDTSSQRDNIHIEIVASSLYVNPHEAESIISEKKKTGIVVFTLNLNASFIKLYDGEATGSMKGSCKNIPIEFFGDSTFGRLYRAPIWCLIDKAN